MKQKSIVYKLIDHRVSTAITTLKNSQFNSVKTYHNGQTPSVSILFPTIGFGRNK